MRITDSVSIRRCTKRTGLHLPRPQLLGNSLQGDCSQDDQKTVKKGTGNHELIPLCAFYRWVVLDVTENSPVCSSTSKAKCFYSWRAVLAYNSVGRIRVTFLTKNRVVKALLWFGGNVAM